MENLTKQQIVLVTLLVSFVTSIATGIVTVSLMDQAPAGVTQTINRVVERTIEKVVTAPTQSQTASVVTKETIVVKEDDLVMEAVEKNSPSLVRIVEPWAEAGLAPRIVALGLIVGKDGFVVADKSPFVAGLKYSAQMADGKIYPLGLVSTYEPSRLSLFKMEFSDNPISLDVASIVDAGNIKLGQAVVMIGGKTRNKIETGIVSSLINKESDSKVANSANNATSTVETTVKEIASIETSVKGGDSFYGDILVNLLGDVIGYKVLRYDGWTIIPAEEISKSLKNYSDQLKATQKTETVENTGQ